MLCFFISSKKLEILTEITGAHLCRKMTLALIFKENAISWRKLAMSPKIAENCNHSIDPWLAADLWQTNADIQNIEICHKCWSQAVTKICAVVAPT
jgi:hypothetical protein